MFTAAAAREQKVKKARMEEMKKSLKWRMNRNDEGDSIMGISII